MMDPDTYIPPASRRDRVDTLPLFASVAPKEGGYEAARDRLRLTGALGRVLALLLDGQWHTIGELRDVGGSSGDRRGRELRKLGLTIDRVRDPDHPVDSGIWLYRLRQPTPEQLAHVEAHVGKGKKEATP